MGTTRTALVTGATSGLGLATVRRLAATPGWRVVLAVRDLRRGRALAGELGPDTGLVALDLASLASVREAAAAVAGQEPPVDVLVLNAGLQVTRSDVASADGHELTFAVNHLGNYLLTRLLLPQLASGGRVVTVGSGTHFGTLRKSGPYPRPRWEDPRVLATPREGSGQRAYATSKLATVYLSRELARRTRGSTSSRSTRACCRPPAWPATTPPARRPSTAGSPRCSSGCRARRPSSGPPASSPTW
ncbi:SDR family NAD(P)-dependent oxidoreductase [Geodermatophilus nigrescens]